MINKNIIKNIIEEVDSIYKLVAKRYVSGKNCKLHKKLVYNLDKQKFIARESYSSESYEFTYLILEFNVNRYCHLTIDASVRLGNNHCQDDKVQQLLQDLGISQTIPEKKRIYNHPLFTHTVWTELENARYCTKTNLDNIVSPIEEILQPDKVQELTWGVVVDHTNFDDVDDDEIFIYDNEIWVKEDEVKLEDEDWEEVNKKLDDWQITVDDDEYHDYQIIDCDDWRILAHHAYCFIPRHYILLHQTPKYFEKEIVEMLLSYRILGVDLLPLIA